MHPRAACRRGVHLTSRRGCRRHPSSTGPIASKFSSANPKDQLPHGNPRRPHSCDASPSVDATVTAFHRFRCLPGWEHQAVEGEAARQADSPAATCLANDGRPVGIRVHGQQTALTQESAPRVKFGTERHPPEVAAVHIRNSVMTSQTFVEECIVCIQ